MTSVNYHGYFSPLSGYGIANINWAKHLKRHGVDVSINGKFEPREGSYEWGVLDDEERQMFGYEYVKRRVGIIESNPFDFDNLQTEVKIANTMCESDHLSPVWADKLNSMDYIIVPNEFNKRVFEKSGVTKPIKVIPHGVDTKRFAYYERPERETFTFGILGYLDFTDRKGAFDLIRAFSSEFDEPDVRLILKSSNPGFGYYSRFADSRIRTITDNFDTKELVRFYNSLDCFVFPSKAEGIGYPPREAMSTGLPTIVTNWSGLEDIAHPAISFPLNDLKFEKRPMFIEQDGNWALPDIQELMYQMRYIYENRDMAKATGKNASDYMEKHFSWEKCSYQLKEFLQTIEG